MQSPQPDMCREIYSQLTSIISVGTDRQPRNLLYSTPDSAVGMSWHASRKNPDRCIVIGASRSSVALGEGRRLRVTA
ncbi:hypothetical protein Cba03nite_42050 [Catellatospora bangladeshensis]|uniref:Uncharacterized protein n=1 Tax=Catellatospora bangladeshensis TaxID=310355 RepID=A0A8J3NKN2_9ACTN|nr:hypothetical protein Cba03nite_42050 [Catellatospora bangladeshensis]